MTLTIMMPLDSAARVSTLENHNPPIILDRGVARTHRDRVPLPVTRSLGRLIKTVADTCFHFLQAGWAGPHSPAHHT